MHTILQSLQHKLIVSCQAFPNDPMEDTETLRRVARSAVVGGASGLRLNSPEHVRAIRQDTDLPIIAIEKSFIGGQLRITPDFASAATLAAAGANIIALDCTDREHKHGEPWREIVRRIHDELGLLVMADIATLHDGILAAEGGADIVAPTLHGYTDETKHSLGFHPDLVTALARETGKPIIAEGNVSTPALARIALEAGAWSVVVGSAITRPGTITATFVKEMASVGRSNQPGYVVGIDIGGTAVKAAVVSADGMIQFAHDVPTQANQGREAIVQALDTALGKTIRAASDAGLNLSGIGVASAGAIDAKNGTVFAATDNLPGWADFDIRQHLRTISSLPVCVENDAQSAVLAEVRFGNARGLSNVVAVTIGTGVGGGVVVDGRLVRGKFGFAGTIGHQTIRFDGRACNCGRRGCLEAYVSTLALVEEYRQQKPDAFADQPTSTAAREISRLSIEGDITACQAYARLAGYLAEGLANIFNVLDPDAIVLSGGLIEGQPAFARDVQERVQSLIHFGNKRPPVILHSESGRYAGVLGAAVSAFRQLGEAGH